MHSILPIHSFITIQPLGRFSRNQNPVRRPVWLWHTASWASRLPLLSPAFRRSHLLRQVPSCPTTRETSRSGRWNSSWARKCSYKFRLRIRLPRNSRDLLHAANLRHGTNGFISPSKKGVLKIFFALKNPTASAGFEPANLGTKGQHATSRPPYLYSTVTAKI